MDMVFSHGLMEDSTMDNGSMENRRELVCIIMLKEKLNMGNGQMEKEYAGFWKVNI